MTRTDARRCRRPSPSRPAGFGRHSGLILATLHGCLAMFFFAAAWAKLTEPFDLLSLMMIWPADTTPDVVRAVGWIEFVLARVAAPLVRDWRGRIAALAAGLTLSGNAAFMTASYIVQRDPGLVTTNLLLVLIRAAILIGHRRPRTRSEPGPAPSTTTSRNV